MNRDYNDKNQNYENDERDIQPAPAKRQQQYSRQADDFYDQDEAVDDTDSADESEEKVSIPAMLFDIVETLSVATCVIVLLFAFVFRIAIVNGPSMEETLYERDVLIVSDLFFEPKYGDIIVFQKLSSPLLGDEAVVKRVIATEGQVVDIDFETWTLTIDGVVINEPYMYLDTGARLRTSDLKFPLTVPEGMIFVMGDNRNHSSDSRASEIGFIDERCVFGRVIMRVYPLGKFDIFERINL